MAWEVETPIKQMAPLKVLGPDGIPPIFYQNYWQLIGNDVTQSILSFLNIATLPTYLNHTFMTLIPKVKSPELISEYRPISLYNVLCKIFSKVMEIDLKKCCTVLLQNIKVLLLKVDLFLIIFWLLLRLYIACKNIKRMMII